MSYILYKSGNLRDGAMPTRTELSRHATIEEAAQAARLLHPTSDGWYCHEEYDRAGDGWDGFFARGLSSELYSVDRALEVAS